MIMNNAKFLKLTLIILTAIILVGIFYYFYGNTARIVLDVWFEPEEYASMILKDYLSSTNEDLGHTHAVEYDLNGDGKNEIIGVTFFNPCRGDNEGGAIFILEKDDNGNYRKLPVSGLYYKGEKCGILNHKTNGYHDLQMYHANKKPIAKIKYLSDSGKYSYKYLYPKKFSLSNFMYNDDEKALKVFNLLCDGEEHASKILKDYINSINDDYKGDASAVEYDLNGDGKKDIIGVSFTRAFMDDRGGPLFVLLKEDDDNYSMLPTYASYFIGQKAAIIKHKTNGYHDLVIYYMNETLGTKIRYKKPKRCKIGYVHE